MRKIPFHPNYVRVMAVACLWALPAAAVLAQEFQGFEPAQIERQVETAPAPVTAPRPTPLPPATGARVEMPEQSFTLAGVLIEGSTVYDNLEFLPLYQPWLGREITVAALRELAEEITRRYHDDGYFLSSALVPAQAIEFGVIRIRIVEGHIEDWRFSNDGAKPDPLVDRILQKVLAQRPVRRADLIGALRAINELPDLTVTPEVRSLRGRPGAYRLLLAAERTRASGSVSLDNRGSEFIGPLRAIASLGAFGLLGRHETWRLQLATAAETEELVYMEASTEWPLGVNGLRVQAGVSGIRSRPGGDLAAIDARIANERYRLGLAMPMTRTANSLSTVGAQLGVWRSQTDVLGARRLEDRLTTVQLNYRGVQAAGVDRVRALALSLTQGLSAGDSRVIDTQLGAGVGDPEFTRANINLTARRGIGEDWELSGALDGQYAAKAVPSSERYSIGGAQFGRAYDPSELSGDHGLAARAELSRRNLSTGSARLGPYGFYDLGAVWRIDQRRFDQRASAASAGLGLRATGKALSATAEIAQPLTRAVASEDSGRKRPRVFGTLTWRF